MSDHSKGKSDSYATAPSHRSSRKLCISTITSNSKKHQERAQPKDAAKGTKMAGDTKSKGAPQRSDGEPVVVPDIVVIPSREDPPRKDEATSGPRAVSESAMATSTPDQGIVDKPRSDSALLRIRTQIRAASIASKEASIQGTSEPADEDEQNDSMMSESSIGAGGALHEIPRLAATLLQKTKARLEESKNLSREIRESVCDWLHGLFEMVLRLADSRNRHISEKERSKAYYERQLAKMQAKQVTNLESLHQEINSKNEVIGEEVRKTFKEAESVRWLLYEAEEKRKEQDSAIKSIMNDLHNLVDQRNSPASNKPETNKRTYSETAKMRGKIHESVTIAPTTRELVAKPHYPLVVESADPRDTCEDVVKLIKTNVDVIQLGVGITSVRKRKNQKVVIGCDSEADRSKLETAIKSTDKKLTVSQIQTKKPLLKLIGVIQDITDKQIIEAILKQNASRISGVNEQDIYIKVMRRQKGRTRETSNVIIEVTSQLWLLLKDQKLRIGYQLIPAIDQSPIVQCYQCMGFAHLARECKGDVSCGYCGDNHDTRQCHSRSDTPTCCNCRRQGKEISEHSHAAYSSDCPEWQKWDSIARQSVSYC